MSLNGRPSRIDGCGRLIPAGRDPGAAEMAMQDFNRVQDEIRRNGGLSGGEHCWRAAEAIAGQPRVSVAGNRIASTASSLTSSERIGEVPEGFGKGFIWDRADAEILLEMFINVA